MQTVKDMGKRIMNWLFGARDHYLDPATTEAHTWTPPKAAGEPPKAAAPRKITRQMVARRIFMPSIWNNIATLADGTQYSMQPDGWRRLTPRRHERT